MWEVAASGRVFHAPVQADHQPQDHQARRAAPRAEAEDPPQVVQLRPHEGHRQQAPVLQPQGGAAAEQDKAHRAQGQAAGDPALHGREQAVPAAHGRGPAGDPQQEGDPAAASEGDEQHQGASAGAPRGARGEQGRHAVGPGEAGVSGAALVVERPPLLLQAGQVTGAPALGGVLHGPVPAPLLGRGAQESPPHRAVRRAGGPRLLCRGPRAHRQAAAEGHHAARAVQVQRPAPLLLPGAAGQVIRQRVPAELLLLEEGPEGQGAGRPEPGDFRRGHQPEDQRGVMFMRCNATIAHSNY